jgi:glucokinase
MSTHSAKPNLESLLVGDIGGTHARLGIATWNAASGAVSIAATALLKCANYRTLAALLQDYLHTLSIAQPRQACLAIAGTLQGNIGTFTNIDWRVDGDELAAQLQLNHVLLLNDFGALAYSVPFLPATDLVDVRTAERSSVQTTSGPISVMGAGTGFGVALLIPEEGISADGIPESRRWTLVTTEGGHVSFAPTSQRQAQLWEFLDGAHQHISVEHILSGNGIVNIHRALQTILNKPGAALLASEISAHALQGDDPVCVAALELFCEIFGGVAGNIALTHGATGGIYLGGGILPKIKAFFLRSRFNEQFCRKGIMARYNEALSIKMIESDYAALTGAAMRYYHRAQH